MLYDESVGDNIGPYVDPLNNPGGDYLPDSNAAGGSGEADGTPEGADAPNTGDDGVVVLADGHIRQTTPVLVEEAGDDGGEMKAYYVADGFKVFIPFLLRKTLQVEIRNDVDDDFDVVYYDFYFVPAGQDADPPLEAKVMSIKVAPYDYYRANRYGGGAAATENKTDEPVYILQTLEEETLPSDFPNLSDFIEIQNALVSKWDFQRITPEDAPTE